MRRIDLVDKAAKKTGLETETVKKAMEALLDSMEKALVNQENIYLRGFGTFEVITRKRKKGQDIRNKKTIIIPERKDVKFRASKRIKSILREGK
jgi:DNA-binding protein HU-beta